MDWGVDIRYWILGSGEWILDIGDWILGIKDGSDWG